MLTHALDRLEDTIELENSALLVRDFSALDDFNRRKSQSLLEITRILRSVSDGSLNANHGRRLGDLRAKLELNYELLGNYMRAAHEVQNIISGAIQSADSDGTYSAPQMRVSVPA